MENRKCKRVHFVCQAEVVTSGQWFEAVTDNISICGMFIRTDHRMPVGVMAVISLNLNKTHIGDVNGVVVRSDNKGLAVQFRSFDMDSFNHIKTLVHRPPSYFYNSYTAKMAL